LTEKYYKQFNLINKIFEVLKNENLALEFLPNEKEDIYNGIYRAFSFKFNPKILLNA